MIAAARRLKKRADFARIMQGGKRRIVGHFLVFNAPAAGEGRFGVVVSKKISKSAAARNKLRRQILSGLNEIIKTVDEKNKLDRILVLTKKPAEPGAFTALRGDLEKICR